MFYEACEFQMPQAFVCAPAAKKACGDATFSDDPPFRLFGIFLLLFYFKLHHGRLETQLSTHSSPAPETRGPSRKRVTHAYTRAAAPRVAARRRAWPRGAAQCMAVPCTTVALATGTLEGLPAPTARAYDAAAGAISSIATSKGERGGGVPRGPRRVGRGRVF